MVDYQVTDKLYNYKTFNLDVRNSYGTIKPYNKPIRIFYFKIQ